MIVAAWLFVCFVAVSSFIRRDAIMEGVDEKSAWYIGLFFGTIGLVISVVAINVIT